MKAMVATSCQSRWWAASSVVSQAAEKLGSATYFHRIGRRPLRVKSAPTTLTARNVNGT